MLDDMSESRDPAQYGNEKGVSVNHYLIKMINEILLSVDKNTANDKFAVFWWIGNKHLVGSVQYLV